MEGEEFGIVENSLHRSSYDINIAMCFYLIGRIPSLPG
jgi:hypothetical protein